MNEIKEKKSYKNKEIICSYLLELKIYQIIAKNLNNFIFRQGILLKYFKYKNNNNEYKNTNRQIFYIIFFSYIFSWEGIYYNLKILFISLKR